MASRRIAHERKVWLLVLLIKANPELKNVFKRLITTMKLSVNWNDIFVITNNVLILAGDVRSVIFNFDNKRIYTSILEIPPESAQLESMPGDSLLNNVLNMTLYAFGKWGTISGLKVDKDYQALNTLFSQILRPVSIEPGFSEKNFRFFKNGIQITYEDTMLDVLRLLRNEGNLNERQSLVTSEAKNDEGKDSQTDSSQQNEKENQRNDGLDLSDYENDYEIGLWHNLCWKKKTCSFGKAPKSEADTAKSRIGNNFYITNYLCPDCQKKLYMGVYPVDKELLIETEEGRVFMARAYSCHDCNTFYTPRPKKLLQEGDAYILTFDNDRTAYEDYLDILGSKAERITNPRFNEFESERNAASKEASGIKGLKEQIAKRGEKLFSRNKKAKKKEAQTSATESTIAQDQTVQSAAVQQPAAQNTAAQRPAAQSTATQRPAAQGTATQRPTAQDTDSQGGEYQGTKSGTTPTKLDGKTVHTTPYTAPVQPGQTQPHNQQAQQSAPIQPEQPSPQSQYLQQTALLPQKTTDELKVILSDLELKAGNNQPSQGMTADALRYMETVKETLRDKLTAKYDARMSVLNNLAPRQLTDLKNQIEKEKTLPEEKKTEYIREVNKRLYKAEENAIAQKLELSKKKTYAEIGQIEDEIENRDIPEELKQEALEKLRLIKSERANREVESLLTHMPLHMDRKQLATYLGKLEQYKEADLTPYRAQLEQRMDMAEKEEISAMVKRGGKKDRDALWNLYGQLQEKDYKEENKAPYLEKIYTRIRQMDEDAIERICPSIVTLSFADGIKAYEQIEQGMFLPEIKTNTLEMIKRRLTKLKTDESVQLMRKLKNDMDEKMTDYEGFYFYNAREEMKEGGGEYSNEAEHSAMLRAINSYAAARGEYEYPLMVCDTSRQENGREGFVLTPDNIFYHTFLNSGVINILDIDKVQRVKRIFSKGIFIRLWNGKKIKLPNNVTPENQEAFTQIIDDFATYLQEKPESRSIEYMAKESHEVIHCYRCGFVYKGGNACPKCGSKMNR